jgi:hypothetical protein
MEIEFTLPVVFYAVPSRRKTQACMVGTVPVEVDLAECLPSELSPVASLRFHGAIQEATSFFHHEGALYVPHCAVDDLPRTFHPNDKRDTFLYHKAARAIRRAVDNADHRGPGARDLFGTRFSQDNPNFQEIASMKFDDAYQPGIDGQIEYLKARCERLLVSNGKVYLRVSEPVIGIDIGQGQGDVAAWVRPMWRSSSGLRTDDRAPIPPHACFRLDDLDGMRAFLGDVGLLSDETERMIIGASEISDATRLLVDSTEISVYSAAARIVKKAQDWIAEHEVVDAIFEIVKGRHTDAAYPPELGDLLSSAVQIHRNGDRVFSNDRDLMGAEAVSGMWDARSVSLPISGPAFG